MRVVLASFGTRGDVAPFLKLAQALQARGHETFSVTDHAHAALLRDAQVPGVTPFSHYDPQALLDDPRYRDPHLGVQRIFKDIFIPLVPLMFEAVSQALQTPSDLVLVHPWCFGAHYAAERAQVQRGTMCLSPLTWWSIEDPGLYSQIRPPAWMHRALLKGPMRWMLNGLLGTQLHRARAQLGLPEIPRPFFSMYETGVNYGLWSPTVRGPAKDDPHESKIVGFEPPPHADASLSDEVQDFLRAGSAPVVLGLGSLLPPLAADVYAAARAAALALGQRIIVVGGSHVLANEDVLVVDHAPYPALFAQASVVMHHAGINSLSEGLRAGRPQVLIPFSTDQFDNAWRAERMGVAAVLPRSKVTARRLTQVLRQQLGDTEGRARAEGVAVQLRDEPAGTEVIVDDLERLFVGR